MRLHVHAANLPRPRIRCGRERERHRDRDTGRGRDRERATPRDRETHRETNTQIDREKESERQRERQREAKHGNGDGVFRTAHSRYGSTKDNSPPPQTRRTRRTRTSSTPAATARYCHTQSFTNVAPSQPSTYRWTPAATARSTPVRTATRAARTWPVRARGRRPRTTSSTPSPPRACFSRHWSLVSHFLRSDISLVSLVSPPTSHVRSACDEYCRCKQGYESSGGTGSCRRVAPQPPAAVDCVERIAAVSTCAAVGQELHAVTTAAAHGGAACTGASKRCAAGDGSIPPAASQMIAIIWNLTGVDAGCRGSFRTASLHLATVVVTQGGTHLVMMTPSHHVSSHRVSSRLGRALGGGRWQRLRHPAGRERQGGSGGPLGPPGPLL